MNRLYSLPTLTRIQSCAEIPQNLVSDIYCFLVNSWAGPSTSGGGDRWGGDPPRQEAAGPHQTGRALCRPAQTERGVLRRGNIHNITPIFVLCSHVVIKINDYVKIGYYLNAPEKCRLFQIVYWLRIDIATCYHKNLHFSSWVVNVNMGCCFNVQCKFYIHDYYERTFNLLNTQSYFFSCAVFLLQFQNVSCIFKSYLDKL